MDTGAAVRPTTPMRTRSVWRDNWKHLRAPYQLTLAPIFLWGFFLARPDASWRSVSAFLAFHLFLYTGITAFNSFYDRDEGAIGGLQRPPTVHVSLLPLALGLQGLGILPALPAGRGFLAIYFTFMALSALYSHPRTRWKSHPLRSLLVVCGGQGALGFLAGWVAAGRGELLSAAALLGIAAATLTTLGLYPLTQVFQIEEDRRRGDRTLCVLLGADGGLRLAQAALLAAGALASTLAARQSGIPDALLLAAGFTGLLLCVQRLRALLPRCDARDLFLPVLRVSYLSSAGFALFILLRVSHWH